MNDLALRFATPRDASLLLRFIRGLADYAKEPHAVKVDEATLARQLAETPPPFECLVAERGGVPQGFALFFHTYSTWRGKKGVWLEELFVLPEARGRGAGKRLLTEVARLAQARGCARLEWSVLDWNRPAIDFYEAQGGALMKELRICRVADSALDALATGASATPSSASAR